MAYLFEQYWCLGRDREQNDAPAPGMEWEAATPDLVLVSPLACHPLEIQRLKV